MSSNWRRIIGATAALAIILYFTSGIIWVWVGLSSAGVVISGYLSNESRLDLIAMGSRTDGRKRAAWSRLSREFLRFTVHLMYLTAGAAALGFLPSGIIVVAIMYGNVVLVANSMIDGTTRSLLTEKRRESG